MVLVRIDREEPYWAEKATHALHAEGITTDIAPGLREAIDEEWTWINYPAPGLSRDEIRECSDQAQKIHEAIHDGRLVIHAHAHTETSWNTVAVGTYRDTGKSVHLYGEGHLRRITHALASPAQAVNAFEQAHGKDVRPGPAPLTDTERHIAHAAPASPRSTRTRPTPSRRWSSGYPPMPPTPATTKPSSTPSSTPTTTGRSTAPGTTTPPSPTTSH
ncbi:hypothetical protein [Streptomyces sp. NPDC047061]|uniref:hypothetical protein n=1 Tax=Streptomyces sp. NPDC047061 TaxID=3154605 RepID=UPI0033C34F62